MSFVQIVVSALFIGAIIAAVVLLNRRPPQPQPDVNAEMPALAEEAVKLAKESNLVLDYSPESVEQVESALAALHGQHAAGQLEERQALRLAIRYGAYIGEVLRRAHNGTWGVDHDVAGPGSFPIMWKGHASFPIGWCRSRIANGDEDNVWVKFRLLQSDLDTDLDIANHSADASGQRTR